MNLNTLNADNYRIFQYSFISIRVLILVTMLMTMLLFDINCFRAVNRNRLTEQLTGYL